MKLLILLLAAMDDALRGSVVEFVYVHRNDRNRAEATFYVPRLDDDVAAGISEALRSNRWSVIQVADSRRRLETHRGDRVPASYLTYVAKPERSDEEPLVLVVREKAPAPAAEILGHLDESREVLA